MSLKGNEVLEQSKRAFEQWGELWKENAKRNGIVYKEQGRTHQDLLHIGYGKTLLCVGMGASFEDDIQIIKDNKDKYDIACVDKAYTYLMKHGIKPKYVFVADAQVDYDRWCKPCIDQSEGVNLIANVTSNPVWAESWKGNVYHYVNKDNIKTEEIYAPLSGCNELIPAASNVGNAILVFMTQIADYDNTLMIGYDFSYGDDQNYYAFNESDKRYYMRHHYMSDNTNRIVYTSSNLYFSARWLRDFLVKFHQNKNITNCSRGILQWTYKPLSKVLKRLRNREMTKQAEGIILKSKMKKIVFTANEGEKALSEFMSSNKIVNVAIDYLPQGA